MADTSGRLLIVDDDNLNRMMLAYGLDQEGYSYAVAESGARALQMMRDEPFDLVLLDIIMPDMDGYAVLAAVKRDDALRRVPVMMISAVDELAAVVRCIELGAEDYIAKPFDPVLLRSRIGASLEKKRLRDQEWEYMRSVTLVIDAAIAVENGAFDPEQLNDVARRGDTLGQLARTFQRMAREVLARERSLQRQIAALRIEIDEQRTAGQVAEITESDYFRHLEAKVDVLRRDME